jgi:hypothetical protein
MEPIDVNKKRPRDEFTDSIIKEMLDEEQEAKKAKKKGAEGHQGQPAKQGRREKKTLAEIEDEEGGPVRQSMVAMAQTKRAMARSKDPRAAGVLRRRPAPAPGRQPPRACSPPLCVPEMRGPTPPPPQPPPPRPLRS